jgi:acyl-CoA thioesterase-1
LTMVNHLFLRVVFGLVCGGLLLGLWAAPARAVQAAVVPLKIMPLGDSITTSVTSEASYRYWLDHLLHTGNISFVFVGRELNNCCYGDPKYLDFDRHHEGHSGYATWNFLDPADPKHNDINTILAANVPDMVLLHLGTNDLMQTTPNQRTVSEIVADLGKIIDKLRTANPAVRILLAMIIPSTALLPAKVKEFNYAVATLAAQKNTPQSPIVVVDQYTGFDATSGVDTFDGTHPNESGEKKMAARWYSAIYFLLLPNPYKQYVSITMR